MSRRTIAATAAVVLAGLCAGRAAAQGPRPGVGVPAGAPTVSPYINLLRAGNSPALNYYGLVRPQFQTNAGLQGLQQQFSLSQAPGLTGPGGPDDFLVTGHAAVFLNLGGYFQSATGGLRPAVAAPPPGVGGSAPARGGRAPGR